MSIAEQRQARVTDAVATAAPKEAGFREQVAGDFAVWCRMWKGETDAASFGTRWKNRVSLLLGQCGLRATLWYRISHALNRAHVPLLPGMVSRGNLTLHGLDIPPSVSIGPGLYIPHPVGTVVMAQRIGARVSLISGITIGMRNEHAFPIVGNDVFIGAGARILGGITLGDGAQVGANAVVVKDVPPGRTAVGIPARLLPLPREQEADMQ